jgi:hypothetical protein
MVEPRLTPAEATSQVIGLINSRPVSPWPHEIEAIIARIVSAPTLMSLPDHVVDYRTKAQAFYRHSKNVMGPMKPDAPRHDAVYEYDTKLGRQADVAGDVVLDTSPTTWGDLIGLASIVAHEAGHDLDALGERRTNDGDPGPKAAEMLALAVLRMHGGAVPQASGVKTCQHTSTQATSPLGEVSAAFASAYSEWHKAHDFCEWASAEYGRIETGDETPNAKNILEQVRYWSDEHEAKTHALLELGATSLAELQLLLPVLKAWNFPTMAVSPAYPEWAIADGPDQEEDWGNRSIAYFVRSAARPMESMGRTDRLPRPPKLDVDVPLLEYTGEQIQDLYRKGKSDEADALDLKLAAMTRIVWGRPALTVKDLRMRAAIARHWHNDQSPDEEDFKPWQNPDEMDDWGDRAIAHLIHAVLNFKVGINANAE